MTIERGEAPYMQLALTMRAKIIDGLIPPGEKLPSIRATATDEDLSVATVTKAYNMLKVWQLTEGIPGVGTVVQATKNLRASGQDRMGSVLRTGKFYGASGQYARIVRAEIAIAPDSVANDLGLPHGSDVIQRERVTYRADGTPLSVSVSYHPVELATVAPRLLETERIKEGPGYVATVTGRAPHSGEDRVRARRCTETEAERLGVDPGTPVLELTTYARTASGEHIEYGVSVSVDRELTYNYTLPAS